MNMGVYFGQGLCGADPWQKANRSSGRSGLMFGESCFSETTFANLLSDEFAAVTTLHFSYLGYTSGSSDAVASTYFDATVLQPALYSAQVPRGEFFGGVASSGLDVVLSNVDGSLDRLFVGAPVDGRAISVKVGTVNAPYGDFFKVFNSIMVTSDSSEQVVQLRCSDRIRELDRVMQTSFYDGTGGTEGGASLKGFPKPLVFGHVAHISPVLVEAATNTYQVHDGPVSIIAAVYDSGVPFNRAITFPPQSGEFYPFETSGTFKLGRNAYGTVTADVNGSASPYYANLLHIILRRVLTDFKMAYEADDIEEDSFIRLGAEFSASVGFFIPPTPVTVRNVLDDMLRSCGAVGWFTPLGRFAVQLFGRPSGGFVMSFDETNIIRLDRSSPGGLMDPPIWKVIIGYLRTHTVLASTGISAGSTVVGAPADVREQLAKEYRSAVTQDSNIQVKFLLAQETSLQPSSLQFQSDALTLGARLLDLYGDRSSVFTVSVRLGLYQVQLMSTVKVTYPRFGLSLGKMGTVIGLRLNCDSGSMELDVFVPAN